jgi:hypothetical protein
LIGLGGSTIGTELFLLQRHLAQQTANPILHFCQRPFRFRPFFPRHGGVRRQDGSLNFPHL